MEKKLRTVLLVDDDPITNFLNERLIRKHELTDNIKIANDGGEALAYLDSNLNHKDSFPEMIFLDINMPVMDGIEFFRKFKEKYSIVQNTIVVILTTSTHFKDIESFKKFGNPDFLSKPLNDEKLISIINKYWWSSSNCQSA